MAKATDKTADKPDPALTKVQAELDSTKAELEETGKKLAEAEKQAKSANAAADKASARIVELDREVGKLNGQLKRQKAEGEIIGIEARRPHKFGEVELTPGEQIAEVRLLPGLSLNFLVDAVRNGFCGKKKSLDEG